MSIEISADSFWFACFNAAREVDAETTERMMRGSSDAINFEFAGHEGRLLSGVLLGSKAIVARLDSPWEAAAYKRLYAGSSGDLAACWMLEPRDPKMILRLAILC